MNQVKSQVEAEVNENLFKVIDFMRGRIGSQNAINAKEIARRFGISPRSIRLIMTTAIKKKILPIISYDGSDGIGVSGYFVASCYEEVQDYIDSINATMKAFETKKNMIVECFNQYVSSEQKK